MVTDIAALKEVLEFKPILLNDAIKYSRDEREGFKSIVFNSPVNANAITFSKSDFDLIRSFNGEYRIIEIAESTSKLNSDIPWFMHVTNSAKLLSFLTKLRVLHGDQQNPFLNHKVVKLNNEYDLIEASYLQHDECTYFIDQVIADKNKYFFYLNPVNYKNNNNIQVLYRCLKDINNRFALISREAHNTGLFILKPGRVSYEYFLESFVAKIDEENPLKISKLNDLLQSGPMRLKIYSLSKDSKKKIQNNFYADEIEEFVLVNELENQTNVIETSLYYIT